MGGNVSKTVFRKASRPLKNINIENRAQKAIQKQKDNPKPAPRHASTVDIFKQQSADNPYIVEELTKKDNPLIGRVNALKLEMVDGPVEILSSRDRPLPQNRASVLDPMKAFVSPAKIPRGKISLTQAASIINRYDTNPDCDVADIAKEFSIEERQVKHLLKYFRKIHLEERDPNPADEEKDELKRSPTERYEGVLKLKKELNDKQKSENPKDEKLSFVRSLGKSLSR